jgi:hypothetical protein
VVTTCQNGILLLESAKWKNVKIDLTNYKLGFQCRTEKYYQMFPNPNISQTPMLVMNNCLCNDIVGLHNRYLKISCNDFIVDKTLFCDVVDELISLLRPNFNGPMSLVDFLNTKTGNLKTRYSSAIFDVHNNGFKPEKHNRIDAFIKNEIYHELKPPRMIMGRDTRFNLIYGLYTTALEEAMVKIPEISVGVNYLQMGQQFRDNIYGSLILEGDCSKYESTQRIPLLIQLELRVWRALLSKADYKIIKNVFIAKMHKHGHTGNGEHFSVWGCRGSGDMDTTLFNTLLMWVCCRYFEHVNNLPARKFICKGDDNLIKIPYGCDYQNTFPLFGLDAKLILRHDYHSADFCSGKFIQYEPGQFIYVQDLHKIMAHLPLFRKRKFSHCKQHYYYTLGVMYSKIYGNMPVYQEISRALMNFKKATYITDIAREHNPSAMDAYNTTTYNIDFSNTGIDIAMAFKITHNDMVAYSNFYNNLNIGKDWNISEQKRYKARITCPVPDVCVIKSVETTLREIMLNHRFSGIYLRNVPVAQLWA